MRDFEKLNLTGEGRLRPIGVFFRDRPLVLWRAEIAKLRGLPGVEWALRVARLSTDAERTLRELRECWAEIPEPARALFEGAWLRLAALTYEHPPSRFPGPIVVPLARSAG